MTRVEHSCVILGRANRELSTQMQSKIILLLNMARAHAAAISNGLLQRVPQLVQQPEQLGVFLFSQQIGHIVVRLVEACWRIVYVWL